MPIYEYECARCGEKIEVIQKMSDKPLKKHAGCGGSLSKLISAAGFQFKGTGWYVTDYARKGARSTETAESARDSKSDSKESKSTSSNGDKETGAGKSAPEKAGSKKESGAGSKKD